ncbi:MAG: class I SAM-dependent methyltransferase, partial [Cyanobacteria bacterium P01_G01_bin.49]
MINDSNQKIYSMPGIVRYYTQLNRLQPAEKVMLHLLQNQLSTMTMLDIGVGGGRTAKHFSHRVGKYIGIDYCPEMISACQQRFSGLDNQKSILFEVVDARNLSKFEDNYFDLILFSFNGIDYISHGDRVTVFEEIRRVGKTDGYFCFSSHNLQGIEQAFNWKKHLSFNPINTYVN